MNSKQETIGFVGVGLMGHGMAKNMLEKGYAITIIGHRNRKPVDDLVSMGAKEASTLSELAAASSIIHICAPGSPEVETIVNGLSDGLKAGSVIVDCSTSDPNSTVALAEQMATRGIHFADAPLGGTPVQAELGELSAMIGADDAVFERLKPVVGACQIHRAYWRGWRRASYEAVEQFPVAGLCGIVFSSTSARQQSRPVSEKVRQRNSRQPDGLRILSDLYGVHDRGKPRSA